MSSSSSSDSELDDLAQLSDWSEDEAVAQRRPTQRRTRVNFIHTLDDVDFTFRFRLTKAAVESLLTEITPLLRVTSKRNYGVPPLHQLLLALRYYALGTMLVSVADFVGVSKSTAGRIVHDVSRAITGLYAKYVFMHQNAAEKFFELAGFPRVLGAVDGTHIHIQCPSLDVGEQFRSRKSIFTINVQVVCDADLKFMNVVARWPGSAHDATIFNHSNLKAECDAGLYGNRWLLGDSAYPNRAYLLTPILNPITVPQQRYNEAHIRTRNTIERTIGVWKRRFPVVSLTLRLARENIQAVIVATAILHNICRNHNLAEVAPEVELGPDFLRRRGGQHDLGMEDITQRTELINNYFS